MPYDFSSSPGQFLNGFAEGFRRTRLDDLLFILLIGVVLLLVAAYFVAQGVSRRRELARRARAVLERLPGRIVLSGEEAVLLGRLTLHLRADQSAGALLRDHRVFDACARAMARTEPVSRDLLDALRLKIGFRVTEPAVVPASTVEIPEGSPNGVRIDRSVNVVPRRRRRYDRVKVSLPVFVTPAADRSASTESVLVDLSAGGASIRCPRPILRQGGLLEISFPPSGGAFTVAARVVRVSRPGILHVKFESLGDEERGRIMGFLFTQSPRRKTPA
jgi:hypothetical protein